MRARKDDIHWRMEEEEEDGDLKYIKNVHSSCLQYFRRLPGVLMVNLENNFVVKETRLSFLTVIFTAYSQKRK